VGLLVIGSALLFGFFPMVLVDALVVVFVWIAVALFTELSNRIDRGSEASDESKS
jgi:hypothetical protein